VAVRFYRTEYRINSNISWLHRIMVLIVISGCLAKSQRFEILPNKFKAAGGFYFQADYLKFPKEVPAEYKDSIPCAV